MEGWEGRLAGFVSQARTRPFQWGVFDCCLMPCDAVVEIAGVDPAAALRGRYTTRLGAIRALKRFVGPPACAKPGLRYGEGRNAKKWGLTEAAKKIAATLGAPEVSVRLAQRGDICLITDREIVTGGLDAVLGVCLGEFAGVMGPDGLRLLPMSRVARAWKV